jgi:APA family basic amino acid/polyamine antiporter
MQEPDSSGLRRVIGFWGGTALIVGIVIGSGIFRKPYTLAGLIPDPRVILGLWTVFGVISLLGALALAELCSMLPRAGGAYVFLRAAYGDAAAFVFGWLYLLVAAPAAIGALGTFFGELLLGVLRATPGPWTIPLIAAGTILFLTVVNLLGARWGSAVQSLFTWIKCAALLAIIVGSLGFARGSFGHLAAAASGPVELAKVGSAAGSVIWAYDGWIAVSMIAGEVVAPDKLMKRIIVVGILVIVGLYLGANVAYFYAMPVEAMAAQKDGVPQKIMADLLGPAGAVAISACIMCSVFGALNGNVLAKPRVPYALSRDGLTFGFLGLAHPRWGTPYVAILIQSAVAVLLVFFLRDPHEPQKLFDKLTTYFVVVEWFALFFAVGAVFVLRKRMPDAPRPFRTPGYPVLPLLFLLGAAAGLTAIVWGEIKGGNWTPLLGLGIALGGFPVYGVWRRVRHGPPVRPGEGRAPRPPG